MALKRLDRIASSSERFLMSGASVIVALNVVDLLPNGMYTGIPLFLSGALDGLSKGLALDPSARRG
jgi:hypothetical protein